VILRQIADEGGLSGAQWRRDCGRGLVGARAELIAK
jgi:hypothetical protein